MRTKSTGGFTLIELLIVIAIIGILAAVLIPNLMSARRTAATRAADSYVRNVYTAAQAHLAENVTLTAEDVEGSCMDSYTMGSYSANGGTENILEACEVVDVAGEVQVQFTYGPGTTLAGDTATFP